MNSSTAKHFARLALAHVEREYPNKLDHIMLNSSDVRAPAQLHPVFYGSFDWHSCVHGYWLLATVRRLFPKLPESQEIDTLFSVQFTHERMSVEVNYAAHESRGGFERPYGWAWLLMLAAELLRHDDTMAKNWSDVLQPLTDCFVARFQAFLPKATYPVRVGTHFNTAFALRLAYEYADTAEVLMVHDTKRQQYVSELKELIQSAATRWYLQDRDCQAWEPGGDDFLSSALVEAECMRVVLPAADFEEWFAAFLPRVDKGEPATLFQPAHVSDRSDGKIAHLDGLNLSRAWCWRSLADAIPIDDGRKQLFLATADRHLEVSLPWVAGDYMGEHWLATFALLALLA